MDDYPGNGREMPVQKPAPKAKEEPAVESVVTGKVITRKKPLHKRLLETFAGGDARGAMEYVIVEVLIPAAKDAIADATSQGIEKIIFGEVKSSRRGSRYGSSYSSSQNSYTRYSSPTKANTYGRPEPRLSYRARATHDFKEIVLATRVEAETVLEGLEQMIERYGTASVTNLYNLVGISGDNRDYIDNKWGWKESHGFDIQRVREGYLLDLPKPEPID